MISRRTNLPRDNRAAVGIVVDVVARHYGLTPSDITGERRTTAVVRARWMAMLLAYETTDSTSEKLAAWLGKDARTFAAGMTKLRGRMKGGDHALAHEYAVLFDQIGLRLHHTREPPVGVRAREVSEEFERLITPHLAALGNQLTALEPAIRDAIMQVVELTCVGVGRQIATMGSSLAAIGQHLHAEASRDPLGTLERLLALQDRRGAVETTQAPTATLPTPREIINGHEEIGPRTAAGSAGAAVAGAS